MRTQIARQLLFGLALISTLVLAGCSNTIRGAGQDVSRTVDATEDAVEAVVE